MEEDNYHQSGVMPPSTTNGTTPVDEESSTNSNPPGEGHHAAPKRSKMDPSLNQSRKKSHHSSKYLEIRLPEGVSLEEMVHFCLRLLDIRRHYCKSRKAKNILVNAMQILDSSDDLDFVNKKYRTGIAQTVFFCGTYEDFCEETRGAEKRVAKASQTIESRVAETPSIKKSDANVQTFLKRTLSKSNQTEMAFAVKKDNSEISTQTESSEDAGAGSPRQQFPDSTNLNTVVSLIQSYISPNSATISGKNRLTLEEEYAEFHRSVEAAAHILVNEVEMEAPPPPPPRIPPPPPQSSNATFSDKTIPEDPRLFKNRRASLETHLTSPSAGGGKNSPETPLKGRLNRSSSNEGTAGVATICPVIPLENPDVESKPRDPRVASHDVSAGNGFSPDKKSQGPKPKGCSRQAELAKRQKLKREAKFKKKSSEDEDGDKSEDENSSEPPSPPPLKKKPGPLTPPVPIASGPVESEIVQAQLPRVYDDREQTNAWNEEETIVPQLTQLPVFNETPAPLIKPIPARKLSEDEVRSWNPTNVARSTARNPSPPRNSAISALSFVDAKDKQPNQTSRETLYSDDDEDVLKIYSSPYSPSKMDDDEDEFLKETMARPVRGTRVNQVAIKRKTTPETTKTRISSSSPFSGGNLPNYVNATSSPPRESPAKRERIVTPVSAREQIVERRQSESSESSSESSASSQGSSESESESGSESEYEETRKSSRREKEKYERQKAEKRRLEKYERKLAEKYDKKSSGKHHREYKYDKRWFDKYGKYDRKGNPYKRRKKDKKASSYDRKSVSVDKYDKKSVSIDKYDKKSVSVDKYDKKSVSVDKYDKKSVSVDKYDKKSSSSHDKKSEVYDKKSDIYDKKSENYDKKSERKSIDYDKKTIADIHERKSIDKKSSSDYYDKKASETYDKKAVSEDGDKRTNPKKTTDNRDRKKILSDCHDKKSTTDIQDKVSFSDIQDKTLSVNVKQSSVIQDKKLSSDNHDKQSLSVISDKTLSSDNRDTHSSDNRDKQSSDIRDKKISSDKKLPSDNLVKKSPIDKKLTNISDKKGSSDIIDKKQSSSDVNDKKSVSSDTDKKQSSSDVNDIKQSSDIIDKKQSSSDIIDKKQSSSDILDKKSSSVVVDINPSADSRDKKLACELRLSKWDKKASKTEEPKSDKVAGTTSEKAASVEQTAKTVDKKAVIVSEKKKPIEMFERLLITNPLRKISVKPPRKIHGETPFKAIQIMGKKPLVDYPIAPGENESTTPVDAVALDDKKKQQEPPSLSKSPVPPEPIKFKNSFMPEEALPVKTDKSPPLPEATPQPPLPPAESRVFSPPLPPQLPATRPPPLPSEIPPSYAPPLPAEVPPSPPLPPAKLHPSPSRTPPLPPPLPVPPPSDAFNQAFYNRNYNHDSFAAGVPFSDQNQTYAFPSNFADGQTFNFASLPPPPPPISLANAPNRNFVSFQNSFATPPTSVAGEFKFIPGGPTDLSFLATPPPVSFIGPVMPAVSNSSTGEKPPPPTVTSGSDTTSFATSTSRVTPGDFATFLASQTTNFQPLKNQRGMSGNQASPGGGVPQPVPPPPPSGLAGDFNFMGAPFQPQNFSETILPPTLANTGNNVPNEFANFLNVIRTNAPFDGSVIQPPLTLPPFGTLLPPPNFGQMGARFPLPVPPNNDFASDAAFNIGQEERPDFGGGSGEQTSASDNQTGSDFFFNQDPSGGNSDRRTDGFGNFKQRDNLTADNFKFGSERGRSAKRGNGSQSNSSFNKIGNARDFNQSANEFQVPPHPPSGINLSEPPPSFFGSRDNFGNATDFFQNNPGSFPNFFNANVANQQREQQTFFDDTSVQESNFPIINQQQMQQHHQTGFQGGGPASNTNFNFRGGNRGGSGNRGGGGSGSRGGRGSRGRSGGGPGSRGRGGPGSRGGRGSRGGGSNGNRGGSSRFGDGNFQRDGSGGGGFRSRGNFNQRQRHQGGDDFKEMSQQRAQFESPNSDMSGYPSSFKYNKPSQQHGGAGSRAPLLGENGILEPFHQSKRF